MAERSYEGIIPESVKLPTPIRCVEPCYENKIRSNVLGHLVSRIQVDLNHDITLLSDLDL